MTAYSRIFAVAAAASSALPGTELSAAPNTVQDTPAVTSARTYVLTGGTNVIKEHCETNAQNVTECDVEAYFGYQNMVVRDNPKARELSEQSEAMTLVRDGDKIYFKDGGQARLTNATYDPEDHAVVHGRDNLSTPQKGSAREFREARQDTPFQISEYKIQAKQANLTAVEQAVFHDPKISVYGTGTLRPLDDVAFIERTDKGVAMTNCQLISNESPEFNIDTQDANQMVCLTTEFQDAVITNQVTYYSVNQDGFLLSATSNEFSHAYDAARGGKLNRGADMASRNKIGELLDEGNKYMLAPSSP